MGGINRSFSDIRKKLKEVKSAYKDTKPEEEMVRGRQGVSEAELEPKPSNRPADGLPSKRPVDGLIGDSLKGKSFDKINAEITRRKWDQFEKDDKPYILNYADEITSGKYVDRAVDQAVQGVNQGFAQAENTQSMRDSSMGIGLSSAQVSDRRSDMARNKTASLIDVENNARTAATDRENALLAGSHMPKTGG